MRGRFCVHMIHKLSTGMSIARMNDSISVWPFPLDSNKNYSAADYTPCACHHLCVELAKLSWHPETVVGDGMYIQATCFHQALKSTICAILKGCLLSVTIGQLGPSLQFWYAAVQVLYLLSLHSIQCCHVQLWVSVPITVVAKAHLHSWCYSCSWPPHLPSISFACLCMLLVDFSSSLSGNLHTPLALCITLKCSPLEHVGMVPSTYLMVGMA